MDEGSHLGRAVTTGYAARRNVGRVRGGVRWGGGKEWWGEEVVRRSDGVGRW